MGEECAWVVVAHVGRGKAREAVVRRLVVIARLLGINVEFGRWVA